MSDVRRLDLKPAAGAQVTRPAWLDTPKPTIQRAPFDPRPPLPEEEPHVQPEYDPDAPPPPPRRSSLPPRKSVAPPPVTISRLPPPPQDLLPMTPGMPSEGEQRFADAALELGSLRARIVANSEAQLLELAVGIAQAIIGREVSLDPALLTQFAKAALASLGDATASRLRASREAFHTLTELYGEPFVDVDGIRVELVLDHSIEGVGVIAETPASRVDGRISERLDAVLRALQAEHRQGAAEEDA